MAVRAQNHALADFRPQRAERDPARGDELTDGRSLVTQMVKVEAHGVALTAVQARVSQQMRAHEFLSGEDAAVVGSAVSLAISGVVPPTVGAPVRPADAAPVPAGQHLEVAKWQRPVTHATRPSTLFTRPVNVGQCGHEVVRRSACNRAAPATGWGSSTARSRMRGWRSDSCWVARIGSSETASFARKPAEGIRPPLGLHQFPMRSSKGIHDECEPEAALEGILRAAVWTRRNFPRGGFEGLEPNAMQVLIALRLAPRQTVSSLVQSLAIGQGTASTALAELQGRGLVVDEVDVTDRRRRLQDITALGEQLLERFLAGNQNPR
jgi:DNA-binding MarR family transcriptional regulator